MRLSYLRYALKSETEPRKLFEQESPPKVHMLAALRDHDDARMVGCSAPRGRRGPPVTARAGNLGSPVLFLANQGGNLAQEFRAQLAGRVSFQRGVFFCGFHVSDPYCPLLKTVA